MKDLESLRVALVGEWFEEYAGAERVVEQILNCFPQADVFGVVDFLDEKSRKFLGGREIKTTFIQKLPFARKKFRSYLLLMPLAIEQLDLSAYDLVISSSHAVAKGVLVGPDQLHISYVHSPIRYAWDFQHQYLREAGLVRGLKAWIARWTLHKIRMWDYRTAAGVDLFLANSSYIGRRILKAYRREAEVLYPPVAVEDFPMMAVKSDFYLTASRQVPYKRVPLIVEAFAKMPQHRLVVIGDGPEADKVRAAATSNVTVMGYQSFLVLKEKMQLAKAFVFAAEEDFGITPVEAQACGTPVIAFGKGGALETIRGIEMEAPTGVFFYEQSVQAICSAVELFESERKKFLPEACRNNALNFSNEVFREKLITRVKAELQKAHSLAF